MKFPWGHRMSPLPWRFKLSLCFPVNGEKVHLEEVLSKKQEALRILQLHCQTTESEAQRCWSSDWPGRSVPWRAARRNCSLKVGLRSRVGGEGRSRQPAGASGPACDAPTPAENLARAKLELVEQQLRLPPVVEGAPAVNDGLKAELEEFRGQVPVQTQSTSEDLADKKERSGARDGGQAGRAGDRTGGGVPRVPQREGLWGAGRPRGLTVTGQRQLRSGSLTPGSGRPAPSSWAPASRMTGSRRWSWP
nr:PREDICTED: synaptonemal complex central element protein 1-like isoform X1 [Rhinolophus sinicus]